MKIVLDLKCSDGKHYMLRILPYLETPDGRSADATIGYPTGQFGYLEEFYSSEEEMMNRVEQLCSASAIECYSCYRRSQKSERHWTFMADGPEKNEHAEDS